MNTASNRATDRKISSPARRMRLAILLAMAAVLAGCSRKSAPVAEAVQDTNQVTTAVQENHTPVSPQAVTPVAAAVLPNGEPDLDELNRYLLRWVMSNRRPPKNFEDFAATAGVKIPPPPAGKKYIVAKDMHIQLVNR